MRRVLVGSGLAALLAVSSLFGNTGVGRYRPSLVFDAGENRYLIAYAKCDGAQCDIYGRLVKYNGQYLGEEFVISEAAGDQDWPAVAHDVTNNRFLVVWQDGRNRETTGEDIYGQLVRVEGKPWGENFVISNAPGDQTRPRSCFDEVNGRFLVVWTDARNAGETQKDVYGQLVDADGALTRTSPERNQAIGVAEGDQAGPVVDYDLPSQRFLVVWADDRDRATSETDIFGQVVGASGSLEGANIPLVAFSGRQFRPGVVCDRVHHRFFVVWAESVAGEEDIWGRMVGPDGTFPGPPIAIAQFQGRRTTPVIVFDPTERKFLVVWTDDRRFDVSKSDIYARRLIADGGPDGPAFPLADSPADERYPVPAVNANCGNILLYYEWNDGATADFGFTVEGSPCTGKLEVSPRRLTFGSVPLGRCSDIRTCMLANPGWADLTITGIRISGPQAEEFQLQADSCTGKTFPPTAEGAVRIQFCPVAMGKRSATLTIESSDPLKPVAEVPLTATAVVSEVASARLPKPEVDLPVVGGGDLQADAGTSMRRQETDSPPGMVSEMLRLLGWMILWPWVWVLEHSLVFAAVLGGAAGFLAGDAHQRRRAGGCLR